MLVSSVGMLLVGVEEDAGSGSGIDEGAVGGGSSEDETGFSLVDRGGTSDCDSDTGMFNSDEVLEGLSEGLLDDVLEIDCDFELDSATDSEEDSVYRLGDESEEDSSRNEAVEDEDGGSGMDFSTGASGEEVAAMDMKAITAAEPIKNLFL